MRTLVLTGIRRMEFVERPVPPIIHATDVLIRMSVVGVCGSDVHYYTTGRIGCQVVNYPFPVGHEGAGEVVAVGSGVSRVQVGDRIAIDPAMPCFQCDQCLAGRPHTCRNLKFLGNPGQADGCLSEYIVMPETSCFPIPEEMTYDQAAISEPLSIGIYATHLANMNLAGKQVGILGFGPIGMSVLLATIYQGAAGVYVSDKVDQRLDIAVKSGAKLAMNTLKTDIVADVKRQVPDLLDIVFECCGQQEAVDQAIELLKPGGKLMIIGIPEFDRWSFPVDQLRHKEIAIQHVRRQNGALQETLSLMEHRCIDVSRMPTHHFHFSQAQEAFEQVAGYRDGVMKAMIEIS